VTPAQHRFAKTVLGAGCGVIALMLWVTITPIDLSTDDASWDLLEAVARIGFYTIGWLAGRSTYHLIWRKEP
jgi:hypothetical protein